MHGVNSFVTLADHHSLSMDVNINPLDPIEISENPSEILGRSPFFDQTWVNLFFHNIFILYWISIIASYIYFNQHWIAYKMV